MARRPYPSSRNIIRNTGGRVEEEGADEIVVITIMAG